MAWVNRLPTKEEYAAFLKHRDAAREFYRMGKFEEGWQYVLDHQDEIPSSEVEKMFLAFTSKIFNLK